MGVPVASRQRIRPAVAAAALLLVAAGGALWWFARRAPIEQARRFLTAPIAVGEKPKAAPVAPAPATDVAGRFAEAQAQFKAKRYAEAGESFAFVVAQDPAGPQAGPAQWNLTRCRLRSGDGAGALASLDDLIGHYAGFLGERAPALREGLEHMQQNDLPGAQAAFERMIEEEQDAELMPLAHAMIARIHWAHGEPMETVRAFARMFASVKDDVPAYSVLAGQLERYAGGDRDVAKTFGELAKDGPEGFRDIYQYLEARSLLEQDQFAATHDALDELRRRYPDGDFSHIVDLEQAWNLLRNGQAAEALVIFQRLEQTPAPADKRAFDAFFDLRAELPMGIARCHLALSQWAEAVAAFERAGTSGPKSIYAMENQLGLARAYEGLGQLDRAAAVLRSAVTDHPDEPQLWAVRQQLQRVEDRLAAVR